MILHFDILVLLNLHGLLRFHKDDSPTLQQILRLGHQVLEWRL